MSYIYYNFASRKQHKLSKMSHLLPVVVLMGNETSHLMRNHCLLTILK